MGSILVKNATVTLENHIIIDNMYEMINSGELYVLLGPSGSGKTTFLKLIAGLLILNSGEVQVNGKNIYRFGQKPMLDYHTNCGLVFQNAALINNMSLYENLSLYYNYHTNMPEKEIYQKIKYYLDYIGFKGDMSMRPAEFSSGEKILISIVRAVSHEPEYIFWDSPFSNLDIINQKKVKNLIMNLKSQGKTMVLVTSDYEFAFEAADKIGILYEGRIVESGNPQKIKESEHEITRSLFNSENIIKPA